MNKFKEGDSVWWVRIEEVGERECPHCSSLLPECEEIATTHTVTAVFEHSTRAGTSYSYMLDGGNYSVAEKELEAE